MSIALWICGFVAAVLIAGFLYQSLGCLRDRRRYAGGGRWITIGGGCRLYVREAGTGKPTVVFEAGIGATHLNWRHVQEQVAQFAHTAAYDRTGLGWSSPCRSERTPGNIARELHAMLQTAGIEPPYVLVGHSFGGLVVRRYALEYPNQVAGVVLVDPMRCEEWPPLAPGKQGQLDLGKKMIDYALPVARCGLARLAVALLFGRARRLTGQLAGVTGTNGQHVLGRVTHEVRKMPREVWPVVAAHWSRPEFYTGMRRHIEAIPETVREMHAAEPIREIPVMILTPGKALPLGDSDLARIGDQARQIIAPESAHWIHLDEPGLVIRAIQDTIAAAESIAAAD